MHPVIVTQMRKTLNNWKHCWQKDFTKEKTNSKVSYPSFVSITMKLVILLQDVHRRRITEKETSTKIDEKMMEGTTKTKERNHATLLMNMTLMKMMMKWYMLQ